MKRHSQRREGEGTGTHTNFTTCVQKCKGNKEVHTAHSLNAHFTTYQEEGRHDEMGGKDGTGSILRLM
jgi:hypothetical protein